ncbi:Dna2/Cas4 domain-containing protein [Thiotrichales bacterium 19S11-10]|nr:Dna2/Cas4 domain-containing protein [Thiotrichales bacterium 19S11-10]
MITFIITLCICIVIVTLILFSPPKKLKHYQASQLPQMIIPALKVADAKLIFNGEYEDKIFSCMDHRVRAKPDFLYELSDGSIAIVEYKSRKKGVMPSDVSQLIATAIAVKGHYKNQVKKGYILTGRGSYKEVNLDMSSHRLVKSIEYQIRAVRDIIRGKEPKLTPNPNKCQNCGFRHICTFSAN